MESLYIVMPAYNEEENIERVVKDWYPMLEGKSEESRLLIADSGSTDRTHEILLRMKEDHPKLEIMTDCDKQHGPKLIALYNLAIERHADYIFQTDSDGQTDPGEFSGFWDLRNDHDIILGNRTERGDGRDRAFVEKVVCLLLKIYFGVDAPDANAPFRLMKSEVVNRYIGRFEPDYNIPNIMFTSFFLHYGERVLFKVISFKPRQAGTNSLNIPKIVKIGIKAMKDFRSFKKDLK